MKKSKQKLIVIILAIALVGAIVVLGAKTGFIDRVFFNKYVEFNDDGTAIEHSNDAEKSKQYSDEGEKSQNKDNNKKKGKKKDLGGGLYLNPDGSIETEILP